MKTKFSEEYRTEVFVNAYNGISIKQFGESDDPVVSFYSRARVEQILESIIEALKVASFEEEPWEDEP